MAQRREPSSRQVQRLRRSPHDELASHNTGNGRTVRVLGNGHGDRQAVVPREHVALPPKPYDRVALLHHEAIAYELDGVIVGRILWEADRDVGVKRRKAPLVTAIDDVEEQNAVALGAVDRAENVDVRDVLDCTI